MTSVGKLRIGHIADLHLGSSYHLGDEDAGGVNSRLRDFENAWTAACKAMVKEDVDITVIAGDAFHSASDYNAKPSPTENMAFEHGLDILREAGIDVVIIPGNHDIPKVIGRSNAVEPFARYNRETPQGNVYVASRPEVKCIDGLAIACLPYPMRAHVAAHDPEFAKLTIDEQNERIVELSLQTLRMLGAQAEQKEARFGSILVAHGSISGSKVAHTETRFFREPVLPLGELQGLPFRAQCWGHLHMPQVLSPGISYSGSIESCDFSEGTHKHGWWLITLDENTDCDEMEFREVETRPLVDIETTPEFLNDNIIGYRALAVADVSGAIVRVRYSATPEQRKTIDDAAIKRALLDAGAVKIHGPLASITHTVTERTNTVTEEADMHEAWKQYAVLQGLEDGRFAKLDEKVRKAMEVVNA